MRLPPAVTVHGLDHVRIALAAGRPVTLLSAPGAGRFAGALWWQALLAAARGGAEGGGSDLLDCGAAPAHALEAIRIGLSGIVLRRCAPGWDRVAAIAAEAGVRLLANPPASLNLAMPGAVRRLAAWVTGEPGDRPDGLG